MNQTEGLLMLAVYVWVFGALVTALVATTLDIILGRSARPIQDTAFTILASLLAWPVFVVFAIYDKRKIGRWPWG